MPTNTLFYGDNLDILRNRDYFPSECVDLIYLDPPFNSNRNYNVLFKDESGKQAESQFMAFEDTWHWGATAEKTYQELVLGDHASERVGKTIAALRDIVGTNQVMAYLVMMAARLVELHRVLKPTGSLYLHCDPTASHYLKVILDSIFEAENFRNEIVWRRYGAHNDTGQGSKHFGRVHDILLFYVKSDNPTWNQVFTPLDPGYVKTTYRYIEEGTGRKFRVTPLTGPGGEAKGNPVYEWKGHVRAWRYSKETMEQLDKEGRLYYSKTGYAGKKLYLEESKGTPVQDAWDDVSSLTGANSERMNYPTQKPVALLERIISASSNPGDILLDSFCGCGTAIAAAQKLDRNWLGIDITHLSSAMQKYRLQDMFGLAAGKDYAVIGEPEDIGSARQLAGDDRYQFQWWALSLVRAKPLGGQESSKQGKKGSDKGIGGVINFMDDNSGKPQRVLVQVKSGHVKSGDIRDLVGVVQREQAALGVFLTLESPSRDMTTEAISAGFYHSPGWNQDFPRIQILTVEDLLHGASIKMPPPFGTFKQAGKVQPHSPQMLNMFSDDE